MMGIAALRHTGETPFFFQAEDGIRDGHVTGVQTCALPISSSTTSREATAKSPAAIRGPAWETRSRNRVTSRSEERRVGKECRSRWSTYERKRKAGGRYGKRRVS